MELLSIGIPLTSSVHSVDLEASTGHEGYEYICPSQALLCFPWETGHYFTEVTHKYINTQKTLSPCIISGVWFVEYESTLAISFQIVSKD